MGRFFLPEAILDYLYNFLLFLAKSLTLVAAIGALLVILISTAMRQKGRKGQLELRDLSEEFEQTSVQLQDSLLDEQQLKAVAKARKKEAKAKKKAMVSGEPKGRLFVLDFKGGMEAKEVANLREEVSAVLAIAKPEQDEVLVRLESGGGVVHGYGLGASQLQRLRDRGLRLTVSIDKVAASGGYMMACVAQHIVAAPFAIVGSIGVVAQLPNFHRLLQKHDIDFEQHTAGQYKRTLTLFGENDENGRQKFREELESIHLQFKQFIGQHRPRVELEQVATGEHWLATEALKLNLVDELRTSDDYLLDRYASKQVVRVQYRIHKGLGERLGQQTANIFENVLLGVLQRLRSPFHG
jgi:serine protease SohB